MLSDDELLDRDTSDCIFANETPREDSPRTLTRHLINRFGISNKGGTETAINNTRADMPRPLPLPIPLPMVAGSCHSLGCQSMTDVYQVDMVVVKLKR